VFSSILFCYSQYKELRRISSYYYSLSVIANVFLFRHCKCSLVIATERSERSNLFLYLLLSYVFHFSLGDCFGTSCLAMTSTLTFLAMKGTLMCLTMTLDLPSLRASAKQSLLVLPFNLLRLLRTEALMSK